MSSMATVVTMQPQAMPTAANARPMWQTGLMDCFTDWSVCCCGLFCFPCLACTVAGDMNECCLCGTSVAMRTMYRTRYNIPGSILGDHFSVLCCPLCSLCQLKRDIDYRKAQRTFWSVLPAPRGPRAPSQQAHYLPPLNITFSCRCCSPACEPACVN
uniref:Placenta associated 8 n=1 Tax=Coturnix japonica TaxID=93934 RepID=A0A8C2TF60_COTJA